MPAAFDKCVSEGGRVRTKNLSGGKYMHVCFINGKSYAGEVKTKKGRDLKTKINKMAKRKASGLVDDSSTQGRKSKRTKRKASAMGMDHMSDQAMSRAMEANMGNKGGMMRGMDRAVAVGGYRKPAMKRKGKKGKKGKK